ncbi:hypothetical protein [Pseudalkalibacillus salsuginis]|uniref:hypothetical protein n=1 Tax=Pseudalkalibacillus salsuginis TaxID=2910972 RepID=UPI001F2ECF88|nr:hypothetical protein [Pseudalkalibacillus salsuginis]MCF6410795.1 hypothetical protein [Pseudalkalibacillus salsuginis]
MRLYKLSVSIALSLMVLERIVEFVQPLLMAKITRFAISHRLNSIRSADKILVVSEGDIIEQGSYRGP